MTKTVSARRSFLAALAMFAAASLLALFALAAVPSAAFAAEAAGSPDFALTTQAKSVTKYTYEVKPLLSPFNGYVYVKTNNPDPYSFRLVDKSSKYFTDKPSSYGQGVYHLVPLKFPDVKYEKAKTYRVKGGYIFLNMAYDSDGGKLVVQKAISDNPARVSSSGGVTIYPYDMNEGWKDTSIKVSCPKLKSDIDYLIDKYAASASGFFAKLDAVESGLAGLAYYPRSVLDPSYPVDGRSYPFFATSRYAELSLNEHYDIYMGYASGLLLTKVYPFILDSASFPGTMRAVAKSLDPNCTVATRSDAHWLIDVTRGGETKTYGGGTPSGHNPIFMNRVKKDFTFDGTSTDFGTHGTLKALGNRFAEYGRLANEDNAALAAQLSNEVVLGAIGSGAWARVATESWGGYGSTFVYMIPNYSGDYWNVVSNAWVDGHYINEYELFVPGAKFADHPNSDIIVCGMDYTDYQGNAHHSDVRFWYDASTDCWYATDYYTLGWGLSDGEELPEQFVLTRAEVQAMGVDARSNRIPATGVVFDGTVKPGSPFTNALVTGVKLPESREVGVGNPIHLVAEVMPLDAFDGNVTWSSSDTSVATVENGLVYGVKKGKAVITVTTMDGGFEAKCTVTVRKPISIEGATVAAIPAKTYTGEAFMPSPVVKYGSKTLVEGEDYVVNYSDNIEGGAALVEITGSGVYAGTKYTSFKIKKASNKATIAKTSLSTSVKAKSLKKAAKKVKLPKVKTRFGTAVWTVKSKDRKGVLSLSNGKLKVKKGAKKGTYTVKLVAKVKATPSFKSAKTKALTVKVRVK